MFTNRSLKFAILMLTLVLFASACTGDQSTPLASEAVPADTQAPPSATPTEMPPTVTPPEEPPTATPSPEPSPTPMMNPEAQGYHAMAYDAESDQVVLVPRQGNSGRILSNQTWIYDPNEKTWEQMRDGPPAGEGPMAYDVQSDRTILFLGVQTPSLNADGQTWVYDANTDTWTDMEPAESPFGLLGARMVYDSDSDRTILFGGVDPVTFSDKPETWAYDYETNTWANMQPTSSPPPGTSFSAMTYDASADRVIVWRRGINKDTFEPEFKIGVYDYNSNTWEQRETENHPSVYDYAVMAHDSGTGLNILFGGCESGETPTNETWGYDDASNSWKRLPSYKSPSARCWHAMVSQAQAGVLVLFGGGASREEFTNETWTYDPSSGKWNNVTISP